MSANLPSRKVGSVDDLMTFAVEKGLKDFLLDQNSFEYVVKEVTQNLSWLGINIPPIIIRILYRIFATLLLSTTKTVVTHINSKGVNLLKTGLEKNKYYGQFYQALIDFLEKIDKDAAQKAKLELLVDKNILDKDLIGLTNLTDEMRLSLQELISLHNLEQEFDSFKERLDWLMPQPFLIMPLTMVNQSNLFHYNARCLTFEGRSEEFSRLKEFIDIESGDNFRWWMVIGEAGTGKSRLALEYALEISSGWRVGFIKENSYIFPWHQWQPDRPTFLIVDYAGKYADQVRDCILKFQARKSDLNYPVRLLLLERSIDEHWWEVFYKKGESNDSLMYDAFYKENGDTSGWITDKELLYLYPLADEATNSLALNVLNHCGVENSSIDVDQLNNILIKVDFKKRPLFVFITSYLVAQHLLAGYSLESIDWDKTFILEHIHHREKKRWLNILENDFSSYENLLFLSTLCQGASYEDLWSNIPESLKEIFPSWNDFQYEQFSTAFGGNSNNLIEEGEYISPLLPDLLGEYFVLQKCLSSSIKRNLKLLVNVAWNINEKGIIHFLAKCAQDFPGHKSFYEMVLIVPDNISNRALLNEHWHSLVHLLVPKNLALALLMVENLENAIKNDNQLESHVDYVCASFDVLSHFVEDEDYEKFQVLIQKFESINKDFLTSDPFIASKYMVALYQFFDISKAQDTDNMISLLRTYLHSMHDISFSGVLNNSIISEVDFYANATKKYIMHILDERGNTKQNWGAILDAWEGVYKWAIKSIKENPSAESIPSLLCSLAKSTNYIAYYCSIKQPGVKINNKLLAKSMLIKTEKLFPREFRECMIEKWPDSAVRAYLEQSADSSKKMDTQTHLISDYIQLKVSMFFYCKYLNLDELAYFVKDFEKIYLHFFKDRYLDAECFVYQVYIQAFESLISRYIKKECYEEALHWLKKVDEYFAKYVERDSIVARFYPLLKQYNDLDLFPET